MKANPTVMRQLKLLVASSDLRDENFDADLECQGQLVATFLTGVILARMYRHGLGGASNCASAHDLCEGETAAHSVRIEQASTSTTKTYVSMMIVPC